jgi:Ran GTPase-activating protein (RanGAP) involved in mRNA processing and transport
MRHLRSRNEFRSEGMEELTKRLKGSTSLASLAIKRNYIGDKGAMVLASMLRASKKIVLKKLYLGYCNMGVDGARSILGAVQLLPLALTLTSLDLTVCAHPPSPRARQ